MDEVSHTPTAGYATRHSAGGPARSVCVAVLSSRAWRSMRFVCCVGSIVLTKKMLVCGTDVSHTSMLRRVPTVAFTC